MGAFLKLKGPRTMDGFLERGSEPPPPARKGSVSSSPEPRLQMHFGRTKSLENASCGRKCLVPVSQFNSVFGALPILDSWEAIAHIALYCPPGYVYAHVCDQTHYVESGQRRLC